jgi:hypothetical protein
MPLDPIETSSNAHGMDSLAALTAPRTVDLDAGTLETFLTSGKLRIVHARTGDRPFGILLKGLLHGVLGNGLRCARLELAGLNPDAPRLRELLDPWVDLAGVGGTFPPPPGYYLLRGRKLLGYHPEPRGPGREIPVLASAGVRGAAAWVWRRDAGQATARALADRPEFDMLRFFRDASFGTTPRRAPAAEDRRSGRSEPPEGEERRAGERLRSELVRACALLGVSADAPMRELKRARNALMRANHPDRLANDPRRMADATRVTVQINAAWATIERVRSERLASRE